MWQKDWVFKAQFQLICYGWKFGNILQKLGKPILLFNQCDIFLQLAGPRFERPLNQSNPKQALSQMLRMRLPGNQYLGTQQPPPGFQQTMQRQFLRYL